MDDGYSNENPHKRLEYRNSVTLKDGTVFRIGKKHQGKTIEELNVQVVDGVGDDNVVIVYEDGSKSDAISLR